MTLPWTRGAEIPLWSVVDEVRNVVDPTDLGDAVVHYSIPAVDELGTGQLEDSASINSSKLHLDGSEVLISKLNPRKSRVVIARRSPHPIVASTEFVALRARDIESAYLAYFLASESTRQALDAHVQSVTRSHQRARPEDVLGLRMSVPPRQQQRRVADFLDAETSRLDLLRNLRRRQRSLVIERNFASASTQLVPTVGVPSIPHDEWPWLPSTIPDGSWVRLGALAEIQTGVTVDTGRKLSEHDVTRPYLRVANVQAGSLDLTEITEIRVPGHMARSSTLRTGDVVVTEANGNIENLGRGAVWKGQIKNCLHQNHIFAIRVDPDRLSPDYLAALTASLHGRLYFSSTATQVGIATTSSSKLRAFPIPLRASKDQEAITREIHREQELLDRSVRLIDRQLALLSEHRQALITAAVTGQIDVTTAQAVADRGL